MELLNTPTNRAMIRGVAAVALALASVVITGIMIALNPAGVGKMLALCAWLVLYGPAPFQAAMRPVSSRFPLILWLSLAAIFSLVTRRVRRFCDLYVLAIAAVLLCLVPQVIVANRRMGADWRRR